MNNYNDNEYQDPSNEISDLRNYHEKDRQREIIELSEIVKKQMEKIEELENEVEELTIKVSKNKRSQALVYSPHILIILCLLFLVAQTYKAKY